MKLLRIVAWVVVFVAGFYLVLYGLMEVVWALAVALAPDFVDRESGRWALVIFTTALGAPIVAFPGGYFVARLTRQGVWAGVAFGVGVTAAAYAGISLVGFPLMVLANPYFGWCPALFGGLGGYAQSWKARRKEGGAT